MIVFPTIMKANLNDLLQQRTQLSLDLEKSPYSLYIYLQRAAIYEELGYPDLAAGDAYRALLLTDEVLDGYGEFHQQALEAIEDIPQSIQHTEDVDIAVNGVNGAAFPPPLDNNGCSFEEPLAHNADDKLRVQQRAKRFALQSYRTLAQVLIECGDLRAAYDFTLRGLKAFPEDNELQQLRKGIIERHKRRLNEQSGSMAHWEASMREDLTCNGSVRREIYPFNLHEPDRFSEESLLYMNSEMKKFAPKCEVRVTELPLLQMDSSNEMLGTETVKQLGIFAASDIAPGEAILHEPSVLTSSSVLHDPVCDACSAKLPPWSAESPLPECSLCEDIVFCSQACFDRAQCLYHPGVCGLSDFDVVAKDASPLAATNALYTLLVARTIAMAESQDMHPLDLPQIKYLWGDYSDSTPRMLPFSFEAHIAQPIHLLSRLDKDPFTTLARYDTWVINTLSAKFRGTANAKMNERTGIPEVAGVHWLWSLANHSCASNVRWQ